MNFGVLGKRHARILKIDTEKEFLVKLDTRDVLPTMY
jgi:hypothetical protein